MKSTGKKTQSKNSNLQALSFSIGDFIRYWGFRRVHGAIWAQVYLSKNPLSCTDLTKNLDLSKALISPALEELCDYKLIHEVEAPNAKTKLYSANEDINSVIRHVLKTREAEMLQIINRNFENLSSKQTEQSSVDQERLKSLEEMILAANMMLELMLHQKDIMNLPMEMSK